MITRPRNIPAGFPRNRNYHAQVFNSQYLTKGNFATYASGGQIRWHFGGTNSFIPGGNALTLIAGRASFNFIDIGEPCTMDGIGVHIITNGGVGSTAILSLHETHNGFPSRMVLTTGPAIDCSVNATFRPIRYIQKLKPGRYSGCIITSANTVIPGIPSDQIAHSIGVSPPDNSDQRLYPWIAAGVYAVPPQYVDITKLQLAGTPLQPMIALSFIS